MIIKEPIIRLDRDDMEAYLYLPVPDDITSEYKVGELIEFLKKNKVISGIDQEALLNMVKGHIYLREHLIARGKEPVDGVDGHYEFAVNLKKAEEEEPDKGETSDEEFNLDYENYKNMELVEKGDLIATYVPAVMGQNGYTVCGKMIPAKVARELPPLKGKGLERKPDGTYVAMESGRIDIVSERVMIHPLAYIDGDLNRTDDPINIKGDVVVKGSVNSGASITASGTVVVDGIVEGATIAAGGDLLVRGGISGKNKADIKVKGKLVARFIEKAKIYTEGTLMTDIIMESDVTTLGKIYVVSGKGTILGGMVHSLVGIEANEVGNDAELPTKIRIGISPEELKTIMTLNKENADYEMSIMSANEYLKKCEKKEAEEGISMKDDPQRLQVLKTKIQLTSKQALARAELKVHMEHIAKGSDAKLVVNKLIYPKCVVYFEDMKIENTNIKEKVFIKKIGKKLRIESLS